MKGPVRASSIPSPEHTSDPAAEAGLAALKRKIQDESGFNSAHYKDKCLRRRLEVRMRARGAASFDAYSALLDRDSSEYEILLDTLTINVSKFFRNQEIWAAIETLVIPALFQPAGEPSRIWSAGSAGGEEAYSASILLREWAAREKRNADLARFEIVGTDIDRRSLGVARAGEYPELSLAETTAEIRERWFSPGPIHRLAAPAKENVTFLRSDLISDEPQRDVSLILCRNVIIYFEREVQEAIFQRFFDALVPGGFLVLGKVETLLGRPRSLFRPVSARDRIFRKPA